MTRVSGSVGRYSVNDASGVDIIGGGLRTWRKDGTRPIFIFAHGATGSARFSWGLSNQRQIFLELAKDHTVIVADLGGDLFANDLHLQILTDTVSYARSTWGASTAPIFLWGESMGAALVLAWTRANAESVNKVACTIPLIDIKQARDDNVLGLGPAVDAAYGGTYDDNVHGSTHSPIRFASTMSQTVPIKLWTSSNDTVVPPATADAFVAARPTTQRADLGAQGHSATSAAGVVNDIITFIRS